MKSLTEYMRLPYRMEIVPDPDEGGFVISFPELPGCMTYGDTLEDALHNAEDAKREWFTAAIEEGAVIREPQETERYSGQFKLRIPKSLHRQIAIRARNEGVSMNQYCVYLLSKNI